MHKTYLRVLRIMRYHLLALLAAIGATSAVVVNGNEITGPRGQGNCALEGDTFTCSSGATCNYDAAISAFQCEGDTGSPMGAVADEDDAESQGPPGRSCHSHMDHWDCDDGSFCEFEEGAWVCQGGSTSSGSTCIVHGGHTHGDCSGQCDLTDLGEFDQPLHIGAVFILLVASFLGVTLPIAFSGYKDHSVFKWALFVARHFGTGVIVCTALIHLLYHSFVMFSNDCIGELIYEPVAAAIALAGVYIVFLFDYLGMRYNSKRTLELAQTANTRAETPDNKEPVTSDTASSDVSPHGAMKQLKWEVSLLEIGIIFHSVMIGVMAGTSGGSQFVPFLIAIFFEGLGLGSRISLLKFDSWHKLKISTMIFWFSIITSVGIAIGIGVHESYSPNSKSALLAIGILDGLSAGILLYAALVELIVSDWFKGEMRHSSAFKTALGLAMLLLGSLLMAILWVHRLVMSPS
ncbi:hypothetical protein E3P99_02648 [Wallemia hederae]|uniref:Uncharacterized protein n=1 Tax=Wallemia hederae TaxID=1540922 RepID=A0A4V4LSZ2_9BASI|nr:hypothetical protein E3P99_02648 [Wallemia hederae]